MIPQLIAMLAQVVEDAAQSNTALIYITGANVGGWLLNAGLAFRWSGRVDAELKAIRDRLERIERRQDAGVL